MNAPRKPLAARLVRVALAIAVLAIVVRALARYRTALEGRVEHLDLSWIALAFVFSVIYRLACGYGWVLVLRSLGQRVPAGPAVRMWLVTETLRWLPGGLWGIFSRAAQAGSVGVAAAAASLSVPLELLLTIAAWGTTALAAMVVSGTAGMLLDRLPTFWVAVCAGALVATILLAFGLARWRPSAGVGRKVRGLQESLEQLREARPRLAWVAATFAFLVALCFFQGVAFAAVLRATSETVPSFLALTGVNAAGWLIGFFAFFAPTGIGIREGSMTAMLGPLMPIDAAILATVVWRLVQIGVELACVAGCFAPRVVAAARGLGFATPSSPRR
jgi:uncharacterized membrane protein YbhN (UPF0104 family)